ncbi:piezo-type mechanosensitive ion channel component 2-like [Rhopalosiphum padi]|uniref:piezo-type mechanosensitive ion channel component 2-like n=1 Tax=Rhopalosiphum padi TaxID=40932 RepID=UPI00298E20C0|nr:piezo-type mechanosensitive ion channel component 2-like [Rhopalosiphum padi]
MYLIILFKYVLSIETIFNLASDIPWKTINIMDNATIQLYDDGYSAWIRPLMSFDFILLVFASHQLTVFRKERSRISHGNHFQENDDTTNNKQNDNTLYLGVLKKIIFHNSMWLILFFIFWTGTSHINIFSLGYLCAGTIFFWKGTYYFLMPLDMILKIWNGLLKFTIIVISIKVLLHLLGCLILNYFEWHSCIFMRVFSIFCCVQTSEERKFDLFNNVLSVYYLLIVLFFFYYY